MAQKNITVSGDFETPNHAERAIDHLVAAGFGKTAIVERTADGRVELAVHCDSTEQMDAAKQVFKDTAADNVDARTENERILDL
jgi:hypothetical protein